MLTTHRLIYGTWRGCLSYWTVTPPVFALLFMFALSMPRPLPGLLVICVLAIWSLAATIYGIGALLTMIFESYA